MDSIVEVGTESSLLYQRSQVLVGGAHQSNVDPARGVAAHATDLPTLQHPKEPCLKIWGQLRDFIEEEGPAVGLLECPAMGSNRAGKGAALVSEQLALDEVPREPTAVEGHERTVPAPPSFVQCARDVLLAHTCFSSNQDGPGQARQAIDLGHHRKHGARFDDDLRSGFAAPTDDTELGPPNTHHSPRAELVSANAKTIHPRTVGATEIANRHAPGRRLEATVILAHRPVR